MDKETHDKLAGISAISGIPINELEMAYNSLAKQYDPKLDKTLKELGQRAEAAKAMEDFKLALRGAFHINYIDKLLDWLERKLTKIERWWKNEN